MPPSRSRRFVSAAVSLGLVLVSPGLEPYRLCAQMTGAARLAAPRGPASRPVGLTAAAPGVLTPGPMQTLLAPSASAIAPSAAPVLLEAKGAAATATALLPRAAKAASPTPVQQITTLQRGAQSAAAAADDTPAEELRERVEWNAPVRRARDGVVAASPARATTPALNASRSLARAQTAAPAAPTIRDSTPRGATALAVAAGVALAAGAALIPGIGLPAVLGHALTGSLMLVSIAAHEWAHARAAAYYGDHTAARAGRLSLNPLAHVDWKRPLDSLVPALGLFLGGAAVGAFKPVPISVGSLRNGQNDVAKIALAGPLMSAVLGLALLTAPAAFTPLAIANLVLAGFSLLPVARLDGGHVFGRWMKPWRLPSLPPRHAMAVSLAAALALAAFGPFAALVVAGACVSASRWRENQAAQRALQEEQRRQKAFEDLRQKFWLQAQAMERQLVQRNARVLVDRELWAEGALDAVVRTLDHMWERWTGETAPDAAQARTEWEAQLAVNLKENLARQGLWAQPDVIEQIVAEQLPAMTQATAAWETEYAVAPTLFQEARREAERAKTRTSSTARQTTAREETTEAAASATSGAALKAALAVAVLIALAGQPLGAGMGLVAVALTIDAGERNPVARMPFDDFVNKAEKGLDKPSGDLMKNVFHDLTAVRSRPFTGRSQQTAQILSVLSQTDSEKRSVLLVGASGLGKTALVQHIASQVGEGSYSLDMKFLELDLAKIAGLSAQMRPDANTKAPFDLFFDSALPLLRGKAVIVVKGVEKLLAAGAGAEFLERLRRPLESGGQRFVFVMTPEADALLPKDHFLRKFSKKVSLAEPDQAEAAQMLLAHKSRWEAAYGVSIADEAIEELASISKEFLRRLQPQELVDNMEEALRRQQPDSRRHARQASLNHAYSQLSLALGKYRRTQATRDHNEVVRLVRVIADLESAPDKTDGGVLTAKMLQEVMAEVYRNPMILKNQDFKQTLLQAVPMIRAGVVGQDPAVSATGRVLKRTAAGLAGHVRPLGSFAFLGPTGVGKTELARVLADALFGDPQAMIRIDMSEYMEKHSISRLIGSPPGYEGNEAGGQLTEAVRRRPYSVVLFDEMEKAHPDVLNALLQVLEDGRLTDGKGQTVDFRRTIVILTSNVASAKIQEMFAAGHDAELIKKAIQPDIKAKLRPEFINRLDDILVFAPLSQEQIVSVGHMLVDKEVRRPLSAQHHDFTAPGEDVVRHLVANGGYDPEYGARPMRRAVQNQIGDPLSDHLLAQADGPRKISVSLQDGRVAVASEPLPETPVQKEELPTGSAGRWARHLLDAAAQPDLSPLALKTSHQALGRFRFEGKNLKHFSLQVPAPRGSLRFKLESAHMDMAGFDPAMAAPEAEGGGIFGWLDALRAQGYGDEEMIAIQTWLAKSIRCGKDGKGAGVTARWEQANGHVILQVVAPPLPMGERVEAYESYEAHFSRDVSSAEEALQAKDEFAGKGLRARALLMDIKRGLAQIPAARFGSYWDENASTYWLMLDSKNASAANPLPAPDEVAPAAGIVSALAPDEVAPAAGIVSALAPVDGRQALLQKILAGHHNTVKPAPLRLPYSDWEIERISSFIATATRQYEQNERRRLFVAALTSIDWDRAGDALNSVLVHLMAFQIDYRSPDSEPLLALMAPWIARHAPESQRTWASNAFRDLLSKSEDLRVHTTPAQSALVSLSAALAGTGRGPAIDMSSRNWFLDA
ncbi:MAG: AAA family ATPase, partial [Elusimicrobia bacterium]|nr:AAA family ATPase [Elusimicrobiota bacterium]